MHVCTGGALGGPSHVHMSELWRCCGRQKVLEYWVESLLVSKLAANVLDIGVHARAAVIVLLYACNQKRRSEDAALRVLQKSLERAASKGIIHIKKQVCDHRPARHVECVCGHGALRCFRGCETGSRGKEAIT
jgi:hypothetical protein